MKRGHDEITKAEEEEEEDFTWIGKVLTACRDGQLETAKQLMTKYGVPEPRPPGIYKGPLFNDCLRQACLGKHADVVAWVLTYLKTPNLGFVGVKCIDWHYLVEPDDDSTSDSADVLEWFWNHADQKILQAEILQASEDGVRRFFMDFAGMYEGAIPAMQWFWDHGVVMLFGPTSVPEFPSIIHELAEDKEIKILRWLHHHNCANLSHARIRRNGTVHINPTTPRHLRGSNLLIQAPAATSTSST